MEFKMTHESILNAVFTKLSTISGLPKIFYPNVSYIVIPTEYMAVYVIPAPTESVTIDGCEYQYGIIQIDAVTLDGVGAIKSAQLAEKIIAAFRVGTVIATGLKVHKPSYASVGMNDGAGHYKVPITIRYQCYDKY